MTQKFHESKENDQIPTTTNLFFLKSKESSGLDSLLGHWTSFYNRGI